MERPVFDKLMNKIDKQIEMLTSFSPSSFNSTEVPHSVGLIHKDMDISGLSREELMLHHSMLHMFYNNKSGKGLSKRTIEKLHSEVVTKLKTHEQYDRLDANG